MVLCGVYYDDDGNANTAYARKFFASGAKIKINPNGGTSSLDEIELTEDITIENPTRAGYKFIGWTEETVQGYALGLKANWKQNDTPAEDETEPTNTPETETTTEDQTNNNSTVAEENNSQETETQKSTSLKTGDNIIKWSTAFGISLLLIFYYNRKKTNTKGKRTR